MEKLLSSLFALAAVVSCAYGGATITQYMYMTPTCTGSPVFTLEYVNGSCSVGGMVYTCEPKRCLSVQWYLPTTTLPGSAHGSGFGAPVCNGTLLSSSLYPCDECSGGADANSSSIARHCGTPNPEILACAGSGTCGGDCISEFGNLTLGCSTSANGTTINVTEVPCEAVVMQTFADSTTCTGEVLLELAFPSAVCQDGALWSC